MSARTSTAIVGEVLGTVPQEIMDTMTEWSMLGVYAERLFVKEPELPEVPADTVACMRTHDMEPFAALYEDGDLVGYHDALERAVGHPVADTPADMLAVTLERLASSDAYVAVADLDDLIGETTPHNVPGKMLPTIWRRRLARPTSETLADPRVQASLSTLTKRPVI